MIVLEKIKSMLKGRHILSPRCRFLLGMRCEGMLFLAPDIYHRHTQVRTKIYYSDKKLYFEEIIPGSGGEGTGHFLHSAPIKSVEMVKHNMFRLKTGLSSYVVCIL